MMQLALSGSEDELARQLADLHISCGMAKRLRQAASKYIEDNFNMGREDREPLYGDLQRSIARAKLVKLFHIMSPKHRLYFVIQFVWALRIGEMQHIRYVEELDCIYVDNRKARRKNYRPVPPCAKRLVAHFKYCRSVSPDYMRKVFRRYVKRCEAVGFEYGTSDNGRKLDLHTTHSLRYSGINTMNRFVDREFKVRWYARHKLSNHYGSTGVYLEYPVEEQRADMQGAFSAVLSDILDKVPVQV